ncbi:MAG: class I SAM-dependent RNA methyltransferase [Caulobacteraceae bacterium]
MGGQGDGLAEGPVHVPFTLPGERVVVRVAEGRGELISVLEPSAERVTPPCPHFGRCGGCALQHWDHAPYLAWKRDKIITALAREGIETDVLAPYASGPEERRRVALHARQGTPEAARLGYKMRSSWTLVDIAACPISDPRIQAAIPGLKRLAAQLFEHPRSAPTLHVTWTDTGLDVNVTGVERRTHGLSPDASVRIAEAAQALDAARVTVNGDIAYQVREPVVTIGRARVVLPPGAFLQATAGAEAAMAAFAQEAVAGAASVADLFCGVGTFALRLAETTPVLAADGDKAAVGALSAASHAPGLKPVRTETRDLFRHPIGAAELAKIDAVVFDPPRAGAAAQTAEVAASKGATVAGVSCNPATFARDARILIDAGFRLERVLPVDQFLWSPHVELVGVFHR